MAVRTLFPEIAGRQVFFAAEFRCAAGDQSFHKLEENPRLCGWGAEIVSIAAEECFWTLDAPMIRITTPHIPLPSADKLEDATIPSVERIVREIVEKMD